MIEDYKTKNNCNHIKSKNKIDLQEKRNRIIQELDFLLKKDEDLLKIITEYDRALRAVNSDSSLINLAIDEDYGFKLGKAFFEPIEEKENAYYKEYYRFIFNLHSLLCAPRLYDKTMMHFNYQIPLGFEFRHSNANYGDVLDHIKDSNSIDTEFYQLEILEIWRKLRRDRIKNIDYDVVKSHLLNDFQYFSYGDIAVTRRSNGISRVENSLDLIKKSFRKTGVIDKKNRLSLFGVFCIELMEKIPHQMGSAHEYRGIVSQNKLLVKPLNDLIFHFDMNDFNRLTIRASESELEELRYQINEYKSDPKNIALLNLPQYQRRIKNY